jgi:hypothetical protein
MYLSEPMTTKNSFQKNFPFMTCIKSSDIEYVGILINFDNNVTSLYDYSIIRSEEERQKFIEFGEVWWWESNRKIPISIFLKPDMIQFRDYIKTFNSKDIEIVFGPVVNLSEIAEKRVKRKSIQLVRNVKKIRS